METYQISFLLKCAFYLSLGRMQRIFIISKASLAIHLMQTVGLILKQCKCEGNIKRFDNYVVICIEEETKE
jgi:hypothetical protein